MYCPLTQFLKARTLECLGAVGTEIFHPLAELFIRYRIAIFIFQLNLLLISERKLTPLAFQ